MISDMAKTTKIKNVLKTGVNKRLRDIEYQYQTFRQVGNWILPRTTYNPY